MKIRKGLPPGYMQVREDLKPLVDKMHQLRSADIEELDAFVDFLRKGTEELYGDEAEESKPKKLYEFMNGALPQEEEQEEEQDTPSPPGGSEKII